MSKINWNLIRTLPADAAIVTGGPESGATAELCARDLAYERLCHCGTFLPPTRATTLRQAHTDIMNLLANLDVLLEADSDGMSLEDDDRAIVEDIRRRWMDAMKTKEKA